MDLLSSIFNGNFEDTPLKNIDTMRQSDEEFSADSAVRLFAKRIIEFEGHGDVAMELEEVVTAAESAAHTRGFIVGCKFAVRFMSECLIDSH